MADTLAALRGYATQVIADHGLDAITLQICDRTSATLPSVQIVDLGVPNEASWCYRHDRIGIEDPFTDIAVNEAPDIVDNDAPIAIGDRRIQRQRASCPSYWAFLDRFELEVEGVSTRRLRRGVYLSAGYLRRRSGSHASRVSLDAIAAVSPSLLNMMAAEVLRGTVQTSVGLLGLQRLIDPPRTRGAGMETQLTARELEIATLVSSGCQTKAVAFRLGLSEHTVENHLRRVYAKLGIHNRAALAHLLG